MYVLPAAGGSERELLPSLAWKLLAMPERTPRLDPIAGPAEGDDCQVPRSWCAGALRGCVVTIYIRVGSEGCFQRLPSNSAMTAPQSLRKLHGL